MVKFPFGLVAVLGIAVGVSACSSNPPPPPPPAPAPVAQPAPPPPPPPPMTKEDRIKALQTALNSNGAQLTVDGKMGPKTVSALKAFQKSHSLAPTGRPDPSTLKALGLVS